MSSFTDSEYLRWSSGYYYSNEDTTLPFVNKATGTKIDAFHMLRAAFNIGVDAAREEIRRDVVDVFSRIGLELDSDD